MQKKQIHYTNHARARLLERGISQKLVESAMREPSRVLLQEGEITYRLEKDLKKHKLIIVFRDTKENHVIISAYWSSPNQ